MVKQAETPTLAGDAYAVLREGIRSGSLAPGQRLRFSELQAMCGMSLSPVREALVRLTSEGFTVSDNHRGFRVSPVTADELMDILENRKLMEGEALRLSILRGDAEWESRILAAHHIISRVSADRSGTLEYHEEWDRRHVNFHQSLISACGSPILIETCERLMVKADQYRRLSISISGQTRDIASEHEEIATLTIARKSEEAVEALRNHYQRTTDAVLLFFHNQKD